MRKRMTRGRLVALLLAVLVPGAGCLMNPDSDPVSTEAPEGYTEPAALAAAWAASLEARDLAAYAKLLAPEIEGGDAGFEFLGPEGDLEDYPWLGEDQTWGLAEELAMVGHLLDPEFVAPDVGRPVQGIDASVTVLQQRATGEGTVIEVTAAIRVRWGWRDGAFADTRLEMLLVPGGDGYLRIRRMQEHGSPALRGIEHTSWAGIKLRFL